MPLVFATRNKGKLVELRQLLAGVDVLSIDELGREIPDTIEDAGHVRRQRRQEGT